MDITSHLRCNAGETTLPFQWMSQKFTLRSTIKPDYSYETAFQVQAKKKRVDKRAQMEDHFSGGDVAAWYRPAKSIWHYAIVVKAVGSKLHVIHNNGYGIGVVEAVIDVTDTKTAPGDLHVMEYDEKVLRENPVTLILARARARLGEKYNPLADNCEHFATYCKVGIQKSMQVYYWLRKVVEAVGETLVAGAGEMVKTGLKVAVAEIGQFAIVRVTNLGVATDLVGAALVFLIEAISTVNAIKEFYDKRKVGEYDRKEFIAMSVKRCLEGLAGAGACAGFAVLGGLLFGLIPVTGPVLICLVTLFGSVLGGVIGSAGGKAAGDKLGERLGEFIASHFRNDTAIHDLTELHKGDHVVVSGYLLHPRHHVIVLETDPDNHRLHVIHRRYRHGGVLEEWLEVDLPVYRVTWSEEDGRSPEETVKRARSKLGEKGYNLINNNCKQFAVWCKEK